MIRRNTYLDAWKGIAIVCVVLIHTSGPIAEQPLGIVLRQFINFAVSLFVAIAGYFSYGSYIKAQNNKTSFYWPRVKSLLIPYLIWSFVYILLFRRCWFTEPGNLLYHGLLIGRGIGIGYYIILIIQLTLLTKLFVVENLCSRKFLLIVIGNLIMVGVMYWAVLADFKWEAVPVPVPMIFAPTFGVAFALGLYFRRNEKMFNLGTLIRVRNAACFVIAIGWGMSLAEAFFWKSTSVLLPIAEFKVSGFVTSLAVVVFCLCCNQLPSSSGGGRPRQILAYLGRNSLLIYLTHMAVLGVFRVLSGRVLHMDPHSVSFVPISASAVLVGVLVLGGFIRSVFPAPICRYLGVTAE